MKQQTLFLSLLLLPSTFQSSADDTESRLLECRKLNDNAIRISCYDQVVDSLSRRKAEVATTVQKTGTQDHKVPTEDVQSEELFGKPDATVTKIIKEKLEIPTLNQIKSRVVKVQSVSGRGLIVHLENGQVWKQKGSGGGWRIRKGEVAIISRGSIGSYLMKTEGRNRRVSAERLK